MIYKGPYFAGETHSITNLLVSSFSNSLGLQPTAYIMTTQRSTTTHFSSILAFSPTAASTDRQPDHRAQRTVALCKHRSSVCHCYISGFNAPRKNHIILGKLNGINNKMLASNTQQLLYHYETYIF
jgi:hypothetical protein